MKLASSLLAISLTAFAGGCRNDSRDGMSKEDPSMRPTESAVVATEAKTPPIYASFGQTVNPDGAATPVAELLGDVSALEGKPVRVTGTVNKVCERKGCWLTMSDGGKELFVKFTCPIDGRLIPDDAIGKTAIAEGTLAVKEISEADARHLAEESGKTADQVAAIQGTQKQITLNSPGAVVFGMQK